MASRPNARKTTIVDIAAASGVSVTTVSRILNNRPDVADETRERVLQIMDSVGFAPQNAWQQIRSGRTRLIAVHVPPEFNPPAYGLVMAAALGVEDAGYSINIITRPLSEVELLAIFRGRQADGVILLEILSEDPRPVVLRDHGYPFVMIGHPADSADMDFVDVDIHHGVGVAVDHLVQLGHRRIGFLSIDPVVGEKVYGFGTWALHGYAEACTRHGLSPITSMAEPTTEATTAAALRLLEPLRVSAIIATQERSVIGVFKAAHARSIRIPRDLSLVGMLSVSTGELATPALTQIDFPADELGRVAARMLVDQLDGRHAAPEQVMLRPELIVRGTTAKPRS